MPSYNTPKRGIAFKLGISLVDQANTKLLKTAPTLAAGDVQISKDFGPYVNLTTLPSVSPAGSDSVMVDLSASEMTADNIMLRFKDTAGAEWCDQVINIQPTVNQLDDLATASNLAVVAAYIDTEMAAVVAATLPAALRAALGLAAANLDAQLAGIPDAVHDEVVDGTTTARQSIRLANSALGGLVSGMAAGTPAFRDLANTKNRIAAVTDADGNRTSITRDLT